MIKINDSVWYIALWRVRRRDQQVLVLEQVGSGLFEKHQHH